MQKPLITPTCGVFHFGVEQPRQCQMMMYFPGIYANWSQAERSRLVVCVEESASNNTVQNKYTVVPLYVATIARGLPSLRPHFSRTNCV